MNRPEDQQLFRSGYSLPCLMAVWLWASPTTLLGLLIGGLGLCTGGKCQRVGHTLEFHGGLVNWLLSRTPIDAVGMTLGHVILGTSPSSLEFVRYHEWVHIRQYERWGPMFIPLYLGYSLVLGIQGRDFYRDNPFEIEAYARERVHRLKNQRGSQA